MRIKKIYGFLGLATLGGSALTFTGCQEVGHWADENRTGAGAIGGGAVGAAAGALIDDNNRYRGALIGGGLGAAAGAGGGYLLDREKRERERDKHNRDYIRYR